MYKKKKRMAVLGILLGMACLVSACGSQNVGSDEEKSKGKLEGVTAKGFMSSYGVEVTSFELAVPDVEPYLSLTKEDFSISGAVMDANGGKPVEASVWDVCFTKNSIRIEVESFVLDASAESLHVECKEDMLSFGYEQIDKVSCPEIDAFTDEEITVGGSKLRYKLYSSDKKEGKNLPLVIYNHGGGCSGFDGVLTDDSFACAFAVEESQQAFPCHVMAPYRASGADGSIDADEEREAIKAAIDQLVSEGKVDAERIFMCGASQGSLYTMEFANIYPDYFAAIVLMNGGPMEIEEGTPLADAVEMDLASPWSNAELQALAASKTSVMFVQALGDTLSVPIRYAAAYTKLVDYGMTPGKNVYWNAYTDTQFNLLLKGKSKVNVKGVEPVTVDPITGQESYKGGSFHNCPSAAGWDSEIRKWLSEQMLNDVPRSKQSGGEGPSAMDLEYPKYVTKAQIVEFTVEQGGQKQTFNVYAGANADVTKVYFGFDANGYFAEIEGDVEADVITVTYESFKGMLAGYAQPMYDQIDQDGWMELE